MCVEDCAFRVWCFFFFLIGMSISVLNYCFFLLSPGLERPRLFISSCVYYLVFFLPFLVLICLGFTGGFFVFLFLALFY